MTKRFGQLLSEGIKSVAGRQGQAIKDVEQKLADELGYTQHTVQRWKRGNVPKRSDQVAFLVRYCVRNGRVDRAWANSILTQAQYPERDTLLQELFSVQPLPSETPRIYQNLPPRYGEFLGREADLSRVIEGLDSRWPLISIEGMGGVGKTTLALEAAQRCLTEVESLLTQPFQAVIWVSAKDRPEQKKWLNEVLDTIARVLDYRYITQLELEPKMREIANLLRTQPVLLMVDNFETVEDNDLEQWLRRIPEPSKALLTTRHRQMRTVWDIHLAGLNEPEALTLIRRHIQRLDLRHLENVGDKALLPVAQVTEGNPYAIEMALGYIKRGMLSLAEVVDHLHEASVTVNNIFDYLFAHAWALLDQDAHHLLMASAFFVDSVSKEALAVVADLQGYQLDTGLGQLSDLSLLNSETTTSRYSVHPLTRAFARSKFQTAFEWELVGRERWLEWGHSLAEQSSNPSNFGFLKPEIPNFIIILDWLLSQKRMSDLAWFFQQIQRLFYAEGYWLPFLHFTDEILMWADRSDDRILYRRTLHHLINILRRHNIREAGQRWIELGQAFANRTEDELLQADMWLAQGRLWYEKGIDRTDVMKKALEIFQRNGEVERVAQTLNHLGNAYMRLQKPETAIPYYQEGLEALQTLATSTFSIHERREWQAIINGNLGIVLGRQGQYAEACQTLYEILPDLVDKADYAEVYALLAYYELQQGHKEKAYQLRHQTDQLIEFLGIIDPICEEDRSWRELHEG